MGGAVGIALGVAAGNVVAILANGKFLFPWAGPHRRSHLHPGRPRLRAVPCPGPPASTRSALRYE